MPDLTRYPALQGDIEGNGGEVAFIFEHFFSPTLAFAELGLDCGFRRNDGRGEIVAFITGLRPIGFELAQC